MQRPFRPSSGAAYADARWLDDSKSDRGWWRSDGEVIPEQIVTIRLLVDSQCPTDTLTELGASAKQADPQPASHRGCVTATTNYVHWATLLRRVFDVDGLRWMQRALEEAKGGGVETLFPGLDPGTVCLAAGAESRPNAPAKRQE